MKEQSAEREQRTKTAAMSRLSVNGKASLFFVLALPFFLSFLSPFSVL